MIEVKIILHPIRPLETLGYCGVLKGIKYVDSLAKLIEERSYEK